MMTTRDDEYIKKFTKALNAYKHQRVYEPLKKIIVCLNKFQDETKEDEAYIGATVSLDTADDIANRSIHPITKYRMEVLQKPCIDVGFTIILSHMRDKYQQVIKPLNHLINDESLKAARDGAEDYSRNRQEAELQDEATRMILKQTLQTSYQMTHKALS
ncbi:hypothetical protein Tco_1495693 [Tanacetum coccineum]